ncbi:hypothetical protein GGR51DRAFT_350135 [Nemania sp. FL0031]|nr:hypothetical protein GGR51DRAFT_350135 [Nemania sp. FL0031]
MHRPGATARPRSICQICESISLSTQQQRRRASRAITPLIAARNASQKPYQPQPPRRRAASPFMSHQSRSSSSVKYTGMSNKPVAVERESDENVRADPDDDAAPSRGVTPPSVVDLMSLLKTHISKVYAARGIPSEQSVSDALTACDTVAYWLTDESTQAQFAHTVSELDSTASTLLSLDGGVTKKARTEQPSPLPKGIEYSSKVHELINGISNAAYSLLAHPPVFISPKILKQYVKVQAKLGKPETLPEIFQLYASKPLAREGSGPLSYAKQNPNRAANAIESEVVEAALDTAIAAKNLDAAVGIIENSYGTTAFVRSKLLRHGMLPLSAFAATPVAAYILASSFSGLQHTMDSGTATTVAFAGILAYVGFTASIGGIAITTANDQMKRVTWAPGVPLRKRWIKEEERAALDKIACAWGFQEKWRQGEEEGKDWEALREYIGQKGMVLDRSELMEDMD